MCSEKATAPLSTTSPDPSLLEGKTTWPGGSPRWTEATHLSGTGILPGHIWVGDLTWELLLVPCRDPAVQPPFGGKAKETQTGDLELTCIVRP